MQKFMQLRNLSDPIRVVNEGAFTLAKTHENDKESCDLRVIENPQAGFRQNLHRPPYVNILFF